MQFCWNVRLIRQKHIGIQSLFCLVLMAILLFSKLSVASKVDEVAQLRQIAQLTILVLFIAYIYRSRRKQIMI